MPQVPDFKDFSLTFKSHPVTDDLQVVKDDAAIKQSIRSLLLTNKRERLFNSDIGTRLREVLFEPLDFASASIVETEIRDVLKTYEPRITVIRVDVFPNDADDGYDVELDYIITGRDQRVTTELFLERQ
jgi:phage baseplate assembly protein W